MPPDATELLDIAADLERQARRLRREAARIDAAEQQPDNELELRLAAQRFAVKPDTLRHWCASVGGLARKRGGRWYVFIEALERHLEGQHD